MLVLGIESTCDETAIAVVRDGKEILSNVIASQADLHAQYGGVFPEMACRRHIEMCQPVLKEALEKADVTLDQIDLIAVAHGPGLIGALLIGLNFAKGLALGADKPLVGVNHIEAHLYAAMMQEPVPLPSLGVVISGGHTSLVQINDIGNYELIGQTQDDAIGEAFDKVARLLELPYPGGPQIEQLAKQGDPNRYPFKVGRIKGRPFDFSFSGLKTAVLYTVKGQNRDKNSPLMISEQDKCDVAASFQQAAFASLTEKILLASQKYQPHAIVLGGGVSNNQTLRAHLKQQTNCPLFWPANGLSLDNGAMIAGLGYHLFRAKGADTLDINAVTRIPFARSDEKISSATAPVHSLHENRNESYS